MTTAPIIPHLAQWAETVGYYRADEEGTPQLVRSIQALVSRHPVTALAGVEGAGRPAFVALVRNHATLGIDVTDLNSATDTLYLPEQVGGDPEHFGIERVLHQDANALELELR